MEWFFSFAKLIIRVWLDMSRTDCTCPPLLRYILNAWIKIVFNCTAITERLANVSSFNFNWLFLINSISWKFTWMSCWGFSGWLSSCSFGWSECGGKMWEMLCIDSLSFSALLFCHSRVIQHFQLCQLTNHIMSWVK